MNILTIWTVRGEILQYKTEDVKHLEITHFKDSTLRVIVTTRTATITMLANKIDHNTL